MKKIFLTGASSYLGIKFIELYGDKYDIFEVSRFHPKKACNLEDFESIKEAFESFNPDVIIHMAATLGRDLTMNPSALERNPKITEFLVSLAKQRDIPFVFTSTEAVYGGKSNGNYSENDARIPRSIYGETKVQSEDTIISSGLPYLITRGHRYVGKNDKYHNPKQFPDTMKEVMDGGIVHLDSKKIFTPVLIDHIARVIDYYVENDSQNSIITNIGTEKGTTYYDFITDITSRLGLDSANIFSDGDEIGWPENSSLNVSHLKEMGYPTLSYQEMIDFIAESYV